MVLREPNDPLNQSRGIMGPLENATGVQNNRGRLRQRFDLIRKLGQGTYGKVQLGIDKETGQEVAIKTIKKSKIETEADLIRIRREIQIMSSVRHPNIIHIYEVFENREKMVLVMEYAAGGELYDYLNERKILQEDEARRIFRQIASAAYYCHKHKICHRDLKLENILLDEKFNAKIADFGLSNVFDEVNLLKTFCGSPLYASPEIVRGTPYRGPEVDCWSLGVLLYTLVYGAMPFDGSNFKRLVKQISHGDYFEPKKPAEASPLIRIMLTVDPKKRADIRKVCSHPWVNQGFDQECLGIAEELATQTPVRLDLLLALANCNSAISQNQLVLDQQQQQQQQLQQQQQQQQAPPVPPLPANDQPGGEVPPPIPPPPVTNHVDEKVTKDQPAPKKPKRTKMQSKSKSSPMLELIKDDVEEELELPPPEGKERDEEDACDTLSEISEIQTLAEDFDGAGAMSRANTASDAALKGKVIKKEKKLKEKEPTVSKQVAPATTPNSVQAQPPPPPAPAPVVEPQSAPTSAPEPVVKKTEPEPNEINKKVPVEVPPAAPSTTTEEKVPVKKKVPAKPKASEATEKAKPEAAPSIAAAPAPTPPTTPTTTEKAKEAVPSSRETTPVRKKSVTPSDKEGSGESGEEGRAKQRLKDRADSVSPTRIERRNSKVISQKTAELIQNLETKVSPNGGAAAVEPPPKPPGIKKIVIPSFKVSDAKSKFESKPPRPLTTSVSRSKAAFEAKLQSQTSVEEKPVKSKGDSPPAESGKPKPVEQPSPPTTAQAETVPKPATTPVTKEAQAKPEVVAQPSETPPAKATAVEVKENQKVDEVKPKVEAASTPTPVPPKVAPAAPRGPGKIQIPTVLASAQEKAAPVTAAATVGGSEVKPVLMDSGKGAPRAAVMVVKGKASPLPDKPSSVPQAEPLSSQPPSEPINVACSEPQQPPSTTPACTESYTSVVAPTESDTEGETGKSGGTAPPPLGPAAAAKQKLLSKLPPAAVAPPIQNGSAVPTPATPGANKEQAAKKISSVITKIVSSGSVDKGLNNEDGPKKFSTLPRAVKPESEKMVKTEVVFPVSAAQPLPQAQAPTPKPAPLSKQQPSQERIIPIQLVDEVVNSPPPTPSSTTTAIPSASPSTTSMTSRSSVTPAASRAERLNSLGSLYSRQNSSETESCSVATAPPKLEALRKCPREFLIPIKLEGSGQTVTPREDLTSGGSTADASQAGEDDFRIDSRLRSGRFAKPKRYSSLLSDSSFEEDPAAAAVGGAGRRASAATGAATPSTATHSRSRSQGDEPTTPGGTFKRYRNRRHATAAPDMPLDRSDSFSSAEEDEEDAFQVLTAESLFSNLLDRVRNLTRRINRDDPMIAPNWSTDPATFGLWGNSPLREFMSTSRAPSETRSFGSSGPGSYRREPSVTMSNSAAAPGGAWRRSLSRDLSGDSDSGHSASINAPNGQSRSQMSRLSSDLYETGSARSLPLSSRRSPSYLSHRSMDISDLINPYGSTRSYTRTLSHSGGDYHHPVPGSSSASTSGAISRTLPLRRSLKTFDRSPQNILPEYDTTPISSSSTSGVGSGAGAMGSLGRHSLLDSKYDSPSSYLTRLRSASRERHSSQHPPERDSSVSRVRTLYTQHQNQSSGEANGWEVGQDAVSNTMSSFAASSTSSTSSHPTTLGGGSSSYIGSPMSTGISLDSESSILSPNSSFSFALEHGGSPSRLLSVQEKMNNYSQYYQSLTQNPFRRLPLASPSQIHANSSSPPSQSSFGVGLSELKQNGSSQVPVPSLSRPTSFRPVQSSPVILPLKIESSLPLEVGVASSTSDDGSATPYIQSPNTLSSVTSPSISPPQIPSPVNKPADMSPKSAEEVKAAAAKPPVSSPSSAASSIPRWPSVSVRQHRPLSISSFPDGPRASSVSRVMSPPPIHLEKPGTSPQQLVNGNSTAEPSTSSTSIAASVQKRRESRATSVERITRLLERKSMPREVVPANNASSAVTSQPEVNKKKPEETNVNGDSTATNGECEKPTVISKKPKFLQSLEKKWEKLTHSGSSSSANINHIKGEQDDSSVKKKEVQSVAVNSEGPPSPTSPEPHQAGGTSEESSTHEDKINESVLLRRALSPEKKTKATTSSRLGGSGGTVGFMLGKFKRMEETPNLNSSMSKIPTGRPPVGAASIANNSLSSRLGRRVQMPYAGAASDSVLTLTAAAKETGRGASEEEGGLIKSAAAMAQGKRRLHPRVEIKKDIPSTQEGPTTTEPVLIPQQEQQPPPLPPPPEIQIQEDDNKVSSNPDALPKMDMSSLSPISVSEDGTPGNPPAKSDSGSLTDDAESVSDRILRKSFYNRFNAGAVDRNKRSSSVTPGSSRRSMGSSSNTSNNNLRVNTAVSNGVGGQRSPGLGPQQGRRSVSPAASTVASMDSKESSGGSDQGSSQNRSPSPYWSGLNKYNPNPLFKELMIGEDFRSNDVGKKTEYSRRITSKLSKLLREIESDLNSCQLSKTGSDDGDSTGGLLLGNGDSSGNGGSRPLIPNRVMTPSNSSSSPNTPTTNGHGLGNGKFND